MKIAITKSNFDNIAHLFQQMYMNIIKVEYNTAYVLCAQQYGDNIYVIKSWRFAAKHIQFEWT